MPFDASKDFLQICKFPKEEQLSEDTLMISDQSCSFIFKKLYTIFKSFF